MYETAYRDDYNLYAIRNEHAAAEIKGLTLSAAEFEEIIIPPNFNGLPVIKVVFPEFFPTKLKRLVLPKTIEKFQYRYVYYHSDRTPELTLEIDKDNPNLYCEDNVVYSKDGSTLVLHFKNEESFEIPQGVKRIADFAFIGNTKLKSVTLPDSLEEIGENAFLHCVEIERLIIPDSVRKIGPGAFYGMIKLSEIKIPNGLENIEPVTFGACGALTTLSIPASVKSIGTHAFPEAYFYYGGHGESKCSMLREITVHENNEHFIFENDMLLSKDRTELIYALCEPNDGRLVIPDRVRHIYSSAFRGTKGVSEIVFPNSLSEIDDGLFQYMDDLKKVDLCGVVKIGRFAFSNCCNLSEVVFSEKLQSIDDSAFSGTAITKAVLPHSLEKLAKDTFLNCREIEITDDKLYLFKEYTGRSSYVVDFTLTVRSGETKELLYKIKIYGDVISPFFSGCKEGRFNLADLDKAVCYHAGYDLGSFGIGAPKADEDLFKQGRIEYMFCRLNYPYDLGEGYRNKFLEFICSGIKYLIEKRTECSRLNVWIDEMEKLGIIREKDIYEFMDISVRIGYTELTAYLMELKHRLFPNIEPLPKLE